jgi:hypothetical protein
VLLKTRALSSPIGAALPLIGVFSFARPPLLARSATYKSPKQKAEEAKSSLSALPTLAVAKDKLVEYADADFVGTECVLLAEQQADGSFHIKALNRSSTAVNAALAALYGEQHKAAS